MIQATMEVVLNMGIFRNIDLISQGYYEVQIQIYTEQDWIFEEIKEQQTIKTYARYVNKDPKTCQNYHENSENPHQYTTESFCIGYERENAYKTINMLEFQHKIFLPMDYYKQDDLKVPIYCRAKLFHIPIELFKTSDSSKPSFIEVDQKEFKIGNALIGAYKYLQLEFQAPYACALETSIHCCILKLELTSSRKAVKFIGLASLGVLEEALSEVSTSTVKYSIESYLFSSFKKKKTLDFKQTQKVVNKH